MTRFLGTRHALHNRGVLAMEAIRRLNMTQGLQVCLDAGDQLSYTHHVGGQSWFDRSGNGYDFFRGQTAVDSTPDPTFNTAGSLGKASYWSFDGGDYFRYDSTNEAWMERCHQDSAKFTCMAWMRYPSNTLGAICGDRGAATSNTGIVVQGMGGSGTIHIICNVQNAGTSVLGGAQSSATSQTPLKWQLLTWGIDEANSKILYGIDDTFDYDSVAYTSPSAGNASFTFEVAANGNAQTPCPSGTRMAVFAMWEGVYLSELQIAAFYRATKGRFLGAFG